MSKVKQEIFRLIETLEAIYYLAQSLEHHWDRFAAIRANVDLLLRPQLYQLRDELTLELADIRGQVGALATDAVFRKLYEHIRAQSKWVYLDKLFIDRSLFTRYDKVFQRWAHVKKHALVKFDPKTNAGAGQLFEMEGQLFSDAKLLLDQSREAAGGASDFRDRDEDDHRRLHTYLRTFSAVAFNFLEAYLNGLAYDCFQTHHDTLAIKDHDFLAEWDSDKKRTRFVKLNEKIFKYPRVVGRVYGRPVDLSGCKPAHFLAQQGKALRGCGSASLSIPDPRQGGTREANALDCG